MLKKSLITALALASVSPAFAQLEGGSGYYMVQNYLTSRYVYMVDNTAKVDPATTDAELGAIKLYLTLRHSDPANVVYFESAGGAQYNIQAQGASLYNMLGYYINIEKRKNTDAYYAYGKDGGIARYLGDGYYSEGEEGFMCTSAKGDYRLWYFHPIDASTDNYFGITPELTVGGKNYGTMYASFPYSAKSSGVQFFTVTKIADGMAIMSEVTGTVAAATPVITICSSTDPSDNRLNVGGSGSAPSGSLLGGVYFCNTERLHRNVTPYDKSTMRLLGTCSDGSIGFVTADIEFLPANKAYLKVPAGSPAELKLVTQAEYDATAKQPKALELSPKNASIRKGETLTVTATFTPADAQPNTLTWTSSNPAAATVSNGVVTAVGGGSATISATTANNITATMTVNVTVPATSIALDASQLSLNVNQSHTLKATVSPADCSDKSVTWTSSDPAVCSVDANGTLTAKANGSATITVSTNDGTALTATCAVAVSTLVETVKLSESYIEAKVGDTYKLTATVEPATASNPGIEWGSSDATIATVDNDGNVNVVGEGVANISASAVDGSGAVGYCRIISTSAVVKVESITVSPETYEAVEGSEFDVTAELLPADATIKEVLWTSSSRHVARVDNNGHVTVLAEGVTDITAYTTDGTNLSASCRLRALSGVEDIISDSERVTVYNLQGTVVARDADRDAFMALPKGIYVVKGRKIIK